MTLMMIFILMTMCNVNVHSVVYVEDEYDVNVGVLFRLTLAFRLLITEALVRLPLPVESKAKKGENIDLRFPFSSYRLPVTLISTVVFNSGRFRPDRIQGSWKTGAGFCTLNTLIRNLCLLVPSNVLIDMPQEWRQLCD